MLKEFCNKRYTLLEEELALHEEMGVPAFKKLSGALDSITKAMKDLRSFIISHPFKSIEEEIYFFKYEKPRFLAHHIYLIEQYSIESRKPLLDDESHRCHYQTELKYVLRLFEQYRFQYGYFVMDATELDDKYFLRNAGPISMIMPVLPDREAEFSTNADYLFAKFLAFELLKEFITKQLWNLSRPEQDQTHIVHDFSHNLKWTGDTINLVEIAYGIWLTGQVNHGNAGIAEITQFLEMSFKVVIGRPFRRWQSISNRKRVSPVKYLDQMKAAILQRLDDENA